jgi:predicted ATPase
MAKNPKSRQEKAVDPVAITEIQVGGFKSISEEQRIEIRPLTILAGANSSGKSSMMQPLLLLKQTLEAPYDAGPLLLNGPNVKFTMADQVLSRMGKGRALRTFETGVRLSSGASFRTRFGKEHEMGFKIERTETSWERGKLAFWPGMPQAEIAKTFKANGIDLSALVPEGQRQGQWEIRRDRCFIGPVWLSSRATPETNSLVVGARPGAKWEEIVPQLIHLPGMRNNPERAYPVTAFGPTYAGTFEKYVAGIIRHWIVNSYPGTDRTIEALRDDLLERLKIAGGVDVKTINDVQIELRVGRLPDVPPEDEEDMVNIADVGVGVSQTLPVLVALHAAKPGQLVYVEQPETHLHPRAQVALAQVLAAAAIRGVRVVAETHSAMLLLGIQTLIAEGKLEPDKVKLHWFQREKDGRTVVRSGDLDNAGAFGDWPEDFSDVDLKTESRYIDAAHDRLVERKHG